jgi:hypothetical protein
MKTHVEIGSDGMSSDRAPDEDIGSGAKITGGTTVYAKGIGVTKKIVGSATTEIHVPEDVWQEVARLICDVHIKAGWRGGQWVRYEVVYLYAAGATGDQGPETRGPTVTKDSSTDGPPGPGVCPSVMAIPLLLVGVSHVRR